jgi:hypothetical protein
MNSAHDFESRNAAAMTNGSGAAAILSAGTGSFVLAVLALAGDKSAAIRSGLVFYRPTGPLSGVTTTAIAVWLLTWGVLEWRWRRKTVAMRRINFVAFLLLGLGFLLTFPPIVDLF